MAIAHVRRAERCIGLAIRNGQAEGEIRRRGQRRTECYENHDLPSPTDFASDADLRGNECGIYDMTDDVSDPDFESALSEAKADKNLSRANVVRKIKEKT